MVCATDTVDKRISSSSRSSGRGGKGAAIVPDEVVSSELTGGERSMHREKRGWRRRCSTEERTSDVQGISASIDLGGKCSLVVFCSSWLDWSIRPSIGRSVYEEVEATSGIVPAHGTIRGGRILELDDIPQ
jgi:hypothetical protein